MKDNPRNYTVMCDSRMPHSPSVLARTLPEGEGKLHYWTGIAVELMWAMDFETAKEVANKLIYNNPRIVRFEKAVDSITAQKKEYEKVEEYAQ